VASDVVHARDVALERRAGARGKTGGKVPALRGSG
jgi:hypothetical protein